MFHLFRSCPPPLPLSSTLAKKFRLPHSPSSPPFVSSLFFRSLHMFMIALLYNSPQHPLRLASSHSYQFSFSLPRFANSFTQFVPLCYLRKCLAPLFPCYLSLSLVLLEMFFKSFLSVATGTSTREYLGRERDRLPSSRRGLRSDGQKSLFDLFFCFFVFFV